MALRLFAPRYKCVHYYYMLMVGGVWGEGEVRVGARVSFEFSSKKKEWVATVVFLVLGS